MDGFARTDIFTPAFSTGRPITYIPVTSRAGARDSGSDRDSVHTDFCYTDKRSLTAVRDTAKRNLMTRCSPPRPISRLWPRDRAFLRTPQIPACVCESRAPESRAPIGVRAHLMDSERIGRSLTRIAHEMSSATARGRPGAGRRAHARRADREAPRREPAGDHRHRGAHRGPRHHPVPGRSMKTAVGPQPIVRRTEFPFHRRRHIVLVDDVLYTGRTIRAASTRSSISAGRARFSSWCSSTAATASCPSGRLRGQDVPTSGGNDPCAPGGDRRARRVTLDQVEGEPA